MSDKAASKCWICEEVYKRQRNGAGQCLACGNWFCGEEHGLIDYHGEDYCISCYWTLLSTGDISPRTDVKKAQAAEEEECWICREVLARERKGDVKCAKCGRNCCGAEHVDFDAKDDDFCLSCHFDETGGPFKGDFYVLTENGEIPIPGPRSKTNV